MSQEFATTNPTARKLDTVERIGRYLVLPPIAAGGMATVHPALLTGDGSFRRLVAVKRMLPHVALDEEFVAMFMDEARLGARVRHPNVAAVIDVLHEDREVILAMEFVQGLTLAQLIRRLEAVNRRIPPEVVLEIITQALDGLDAIHDARTETGEPLRIVHRDISPQNLLIGADGVVRVADLGIAKAAERSRTTEDGRIRGKFAYMAPEHLRGTPVDRRADLFSVGVVFWELLSGRRMYQGDSSVVLAERLGGARPPELSPGVSIPETLSGIVRRLLADAPEERFETAALAASSLRAFSETSGLAGLRALVEESAGEELRQQAGRIAFWLENVDQTASDGLLLRDEETIAATPQPVLEGLGRRSRARRFQSGAVVLLVLCGAAWAFSFSNVKPKAWNLPPTSASASKAASQEASVSDSPTANGEAVPRERPAQPSASASTMTPGNSVPSSVTGAPSETPPRKASLRSSPSQASSPRKPTPKSSRGSCDPPFELDAKGHKRFKVECL